MSATHPTRRDHQQQAASGTTPPVHSARSWLLGAGGAALALAGAAWFNRRSAETAERETPPIGRFVEVDGVRLHYSERGSGRPLVLLHGNAVLLQDWIVSGIVDRAVAAGYRVIAFDRPGYGYSSRPSGRLWTPIEQAALFVNAFAALGIDRPIVVGHSWGAMVALAIGLDHPHAVAGLVAASGYYFATVRPDALPPLPTAAPLIGTVMSHTLTPLIARITGPLNVKLMFSPADVPDRFADFPVGLALRPAQQRTSAIEGAIMVPIVRQISSRYGELRVPLAIIAGDGDKIAFAERHAARLYDAVPQADLRIVPGVGHMVHYSAPDELMGAIAMVAGKAGLAGTAG